MGIQHPKKTLSFDPEKASELLEELLEVYDKHKPGIGEMIAVTSNLLYSLGHSISPFFGMEPRENGKGPSLEQLKLLYYSEPGRLDVAFMMQGLTMSTWYSDWEKSQIEQDNGSNP